MRKFSLAASVIALLVGVHACKKNDDNTSSAKTVQNLSGSYAITAITATGSGITVNVYDSLPACERDNRIKLNTDMSAQFVDGGVACDPPSDSTGNWSLSSNSDTIYVASGASYIKSWDGKTLVLTNQETIGIFPVTATTTLVKQ